jgi:hypothetical protein
MRYRCESPSHPSYEWYGARGIRVCERWQTFKNFEADMSPRPLGMTLDRRDANGHYEPGNCRWATHSDQNKNQRRTRRVTVEGREYVAFDLAEQSGLVTGTIINRARLGLSLAEVLAPTHRKGGRPKTLPPTEMQLRGWKRGGEMRISARTHCSNGHALTPDNVVKRYNRRCKECLTCAREDARVRRDGLRAEGKPVHTYDLDREELAKRRSGEFSERQKRRTHCKYGHEYTVANTYVSPDGTRCCRTCQNAKMRRLNAAKREREA